MGRIAQDGKTLVDVEEVQSIIGRSRRAVFYMMKRGVLLPIHVPGSKKSWFELETIERMKPKVPVESTHLKWLRRWHPQLFEAT